MANGFGTSSLSTLGCLADFESRSLCAENPTGEKGRGGMAAPTTDPQTGRPGGPARELGAGWKVRPKIDIEPGQTVEIADIAGPGWVQSIWMTPAGAPYRNVILRFYWDDQEQPSVECPIGDFFASAFTAYDVFAQISSLAVCVNPGNAFNCYWQMPFHKRCRVTVENRDQDQTLVLFYQINYALGALPESIAYFHAQFRRVNPVPYKRVYTILDGVQGRGHYAGTYLAWGLNNSGWWGEGEIKFYLDGDVPPGQSVEQAAAEHGGDRFPTICGTGTEDYFCGSYNFENKATKQYQEFTTPYAGVPHIVRPNGVYDSQMRFSMYRWHIPDPIAFKSDLAATIQALGWRSKGRFLPLQDDIASVAYWYQALPTAPFPQLPDRDALEIV